MFPARAAGQARCMGAAQVTISVIAVAIVFVIALRVFGRGR
jgi:hypothetical protein